MSLEKQLEEEMAAKNQAKKEREELGTHWMQTNKSLKTNFNDCLEKNPS